MKCLPASLVATWVMAAAMLAGSVISALSCNAWKCSADAFLPSTRGS